MQSLSINSVHHSYTRIPIPKIKDPATRILLTTFLLFFLLASQSVERACLQQLRLKDTTLLSLKTTKHEKVFPLINDFIFQTAPLFGSNLNHNKTEVERLQYN